MLKQGEEYVIFAVKGSDGRYHAGGGCEGIQTTDGERYSKALDAEIAALKQMRQASIEIEFRDQHDKLTPFSGVLIKSKTGNLPVVPDKNGMFRALVSPGTYSVSLPKSLEPHSQDYYFVDSEPFKLVPGQCQQLAFVEKTADK